MISVHTGQLAKSVLPEAWPPKAVDATVAHILYEEEGHLIFQCLDSRTPLALFQKGMDCRIPHW